MFSVCFSSYSPLDWSYVGWFPDDSSNDNGPGNQVGEGPPAWVEQRQQESDPQTRPVGEMRDVTEYQSPNTYREACVTRTNLEAQKTMGPGLPVRRRQIADKDNDEERT